MNYLNHIRINAQGQELTLYYIRSTGTLLEMNDSNVLRSLYLIDWNGWESLLNRLYGTYEVIDEGAQEQ